MLLRDSKYSVCIKHFKNLLNNENKRSTEIHFPKEENKLPPLLPNKMESLLYKSTLALFDYNQLQKRFAD